MPPGYLQAPPAAGRQPSSTSRRCSRPRHCRRPAPQVSMTAAPVYLGSPKSHWHLWKLQLRRRHATAVARGLQQGQNSPITGARADGGVARTAPRSNKREANERMTQARLDNGEAPWDMNSLRAAIMAASPGALKSRTFVESPLSISQ